MNDPNDKIIRITSNTYLVRIFLTGILIIFSVKKIITDWGENRSFGFMFFIAACLLLFYVRCIDIEIVNDTTVKLFSFEKIIDFKTIDSVKKLPIFSIGLGISYTIYAIDFTDIHDKRKTRYFYIRYSNRHSVEQLSSIISKP